MLLNTSTHHSDEQIITLRIDQQNSDATKYINMSFIFERMNENSYMAHKNFHTKPYVFTVPDTHSAYI